MADKPFETLDSFDSSDEVLRKIHPRLVNDVARSRAFVEDALEQLGIARALLHEAITAEREVKRLLDGDLYRQRAPIAEVFDPLADLQEPVEFSWHLNVTEILLPDPESEQPAPDQPTVEPELHQNCTEVAPVETNPEQPCETRFETEPEHAPPDATRHPDPDPAQALIDERRPASDGRKVRAALPELWGAGPEPNEIMAAHIEAATNIGINRVYAAIKLLEREGEIAVEPRKIPGRAVTNIVRPPTKSEKVDDISPEVLKQAQAMIADHKTVSMAAVLLNVRKRDLFAALYPNRVKVEA